jgi:hypothetical protein
VGLKSVNITGGSYTDSYNSSAGPYGSRSSANQKGHVCSNGNIGTAGSGGYVWGDAHPGPSGTLSCGSNTYVSGGKTKLNTSINEPAVSLGNVASVNNNNLVGNGTSGNPALDGSGNFNPQWGDTVTLAPGVYYFHSLTLSGGATIILTGATEIYVVGDVSMGGGSVVNPSSKPADFKLFSTGSNVVMGGGADFYGIVYAPTADISWSGASDFFGMILGNSLTLGGGGGFHYDEALNSMLTKQGINHLVQ